MSDSEAGRELLLLRSATFDWVNALAAKLEEEGVPHRVQAIGERRATDGVWGVFVPKEELELAKEIDREVMHELFPDLPEDFEGVGSDSGRCPACQEPVTEGAATCASCGLALLEGEG
jgi:hypothetical protein